MKIGQICTRDVVWAGSETTVTAAARIMREQHIGGIVVIRVEGEQRIPLGIVTDRDIVLGVVALDLEADTLTVGDIMGATLLTANEDDDVFDCVQRMRDRGVRRMPVVDASGSLNGIVSLDDIVEILAEETNQIARLIAREQWLERQTRR